MTRFGTLVGAALLGALWGQAACAEDTSLRASLSVFAYHRKVEVQVNGRKFHASVIAGGKSESVQLFHRDSPDKAKATGEWGDLFCLREGTNTIEIAYAPKEGATPGEMTVGVRALAWTADGRLKASELPLFEKKVEARDQEGRIAGFFVLGGRATACLAEGVPDFAWKKQVDEYNSFFEKGDYDSALIAARKAFDISGESWQINSTAKALSANNVATAYAALGRNAEAEESYKQAMSIAETRTGSGDPYFDVYLKGLALLYIKQHELEKAAPLLKRCLLIADKAENSDPAKVMLALNGLAAIYANQKKYELAEPLLKRQLSIAEEVSPADRTNIVQALQGLAVVYDAQGRTADAENVGRRLTEIRDQEARIDGSSVLGGQAGGSADASGIAGYKLDPDPQEIGIKLYNWEVALTQADSGNGGYEIVQVTRPLPGDPGAGGVTTDVLIDSKSIVPDREGRIAFKLHVGDKKPAENMNAHGNIGQPIVFSGKGTGKGASNWIVLPGANLGPVAPSPSETPLTDGRLCLIQFVVTNAVGKAFHVDVLLQRK